MDDLVCIGDWIKDRVLGSGSFGTVVLWKHKRTEEKLAIKTCKWSSELTAKHRERWTKEVEMLQSCSHPNIVSTKLLPSEFVIGLIQANPSGLPILCMEYCSGKDLRQLLNKPENCSGLPEGQVRQILTDIRNALYFLHHNKITHRDLKPENIVMDVLDNTGRSDVGINGQPNVTYKLIDLGYAKEIDTNSICASFVGTLQYLAPEILYSKSYSSSVDYWSFGLLAFEIICGERPFLPSMTPAEWIPLVKRKTHDNICVHETFHGDVEYSDEIYKETQISKPFKILMEKWLRVALEWDPKLRGRDAPSRVTFQIPSEELDEASGRDVGEASGGEGTINRIIIFDFLEEILNTKIIKIFSICTSEYLAYQFDPSTTVAALKSWIKKDLNIPPHEQILISDNNSVEIGSNEFVSRYWSETSPKKLYLFSKTCAVKETGTFVPKSVQRVLEQPNGLYNHNNSQLLFRNGLYLIISQMELYNTLVKGIFARAESLKNESKQLLLKHNSVDKNIGQLVAKHEIITAMALTGENYIQHLKEKSIGTHLLGGFDKIFKDTKNLTDKAEKLKVAWTQLSIRLHSAARRSNEGLASDLNNFVSRYNYQNIYSNAIKAFISFKKGETYKNKGKKQHCHDIMKVCYDCLKIRSKIFSELQIQPNIIKLTDLTTEFAKINEIIIHAGENAEKLCQELSKVTDELTQCVWSTISLAVGYGQSFSHTPYSVVSFHKKNYNVLETASSSSPNNTPAENNLPTPNLNVSEEEKEMADLKRLIRESLILRYNARYLSKKFTTQKELLKICFDFSFLNEEDD